jgi:hypothetical protein
MEPKLTRDSIKSNVFGCPGQWRFTHGAKVCKSRLSTCMAAIEDPIQRPPLRRSRVRRCWSASWIWSVWGSAHQVRFIFKCAFSNVIRSCWLPWWQRGCNMWRSSQGCQLWRGSWSSLVSIWSAWRRCWHTDKGSQCEAAVARPIVKLRSLKLGKLLSIKVIKKLVMCLFFSKSS